MDTLQVQNSEKQNIIPAKQDQKQETSPTNLVLMGLSGSGKSVVGWHLAKLVGFGFIDTDKRIEQEEKMSITEIFKKKGEKYFRELENKLFQKLSNIRSHVIATGGGTVLNEDAWGVMKSMGLLIWINTPIEEIARKLLRSPEDLRKRPLLSDLAEQLKDQDNDQIHKQLLIRLGALIGQRGEHYRSAKVVLDCSYYSSAENCALQLMKILEEEKLFKFEKCHRIYHRWEKEFTN